MQNSSNHRENNNGQSSSSTIGMFDDHTPLHREEQRELEVKEGLDSSERDGIYQVVEPACSPPHRRPQRPLHNDPRQGGTVAGTDHLCRLCGRLDKREQERNTRVNDIEI